MLLTRIHAFLKSGTPGEVSTRRIFRQKRVFYVFYAKSWAPWGLGPLTRNLGPLGAGLGPLTRNLGPLGPGLGPLTRNLGPLGALGP